MNPDNLSSSPESAPQQQRLNKFVALALGVSRRQADELIEQGSILVNDTPAVLGQRLMPGDVVKHKSAIISTQQHRLIALHKPVGYLC